MKGVRVLRATETKMERSMTQNAMKSARISWLQMQPSLQVTVLPGRRKQVRPRTILGSSHDLTAD